MKFDKGDVTNLTISSTSTVAAKATTTTTTTNTKMEAESKTKNENLLETPSGENIINEKGKEKDTVIQNSTENINGNENVEKEVRDTHKKEDNFRARTPKKVSILGDCLVKHLNGWKLLKK